MRSILLACILIVSTVQSPAQEEWIKKWIPSYPYYSPDLADLAAKFDSIEYAVHQAENSKVGALFYRDIYSGRRDSLTSLLGKIVLVNVWAIGCPPCVRELPDLQRLQWAFMQKGLVVLVISLDDSVHQRQFFKARKLSMGGITAVVRDKDCSYPFTTIFNPSCYLIDRQGFLKKFWFRPKTYDELRRIIRPYL